MASILQNWVMELGLRHQGTLLTAVRGCDTSPKQDAGKALVRCYRASILNPHCGDPTKAATFIELVLLNELLDRMEDFRKNCDHYPLHYVMHLLHAVEIVGYKGPLFFADGSRNHVVQREAWGWFYAKLCRSLHLNVETEKEMDARLNAPEELFAQQDRMCELEKCK